MGLFTTIRNSLAFRSGNIYRFLLGIIPISKKIKKEEDDKILVFLTGIKQLPMLQESVYSFYISNNKLPSLKIFTDGTVSREKLTKYFSWYPNSLEIIEKGDCIDYHNNKERDNLVRFAKKNPMGLKLAAIIQIADNSPCFYCDTDILAFNDLEYLMPKLSLGIAKKYLCMSQDYQTAYDDYIQEKYFPNLNQSPFYCAGFLFLSGNILDFHIMDTILADCCKESNHFTEQTIFAGLNRTYFNQHWSDELITLFQNDQQSLAPSYLNKEWVARHYVGSFRHLFWRDAFFLRIALK